MANKCSDCNHVCACTLCADMEKVLKVKESWFSNLDLTIEEISEALAKGCDYFAT
jgi:hypothetical protein